MSDDMIVEKLLDRISEIILTLPAERQRKILAKYSDFADRL